MSQPPNIVYLHSHDTGRYIGPYGHPTPTPHLNKLAAKGVTFRQAFSAAPTCTPSRAALLTGCSPHECGVLGLAHLGFAMPSFERHLVHTLRLAGYTSILGGLQHIATDPEHIGYDTVLRPASNNAADVAVAVCDYLDTSPGGPFFLDAGFFETHRVYPEPGEEDNPDRILPPAGIPDCAQTRADMAGFYASARHLDTAIGIILSVLEKRADCSNTLIIYTTDHGIAFPDMKCRLTSAGCGVSLIIAGPSPFCNGRVCDSMVSHLDIYPTLCDLAGIEYPDWLTGSSLLPLLQGHVDQLHDELFSEVTYHASYEPMRGVRTDRWNYIRRFDGRYTVVLPNCDYSPSKQLWLDHGWQAAQNMHPEELYDTVFDPLERNNLAGNPLYAAQLTQMRERLEAWMLRTNDPLLRGYLDPPQGCGCTAVHEINAN